MKTLLLLRHAKSSWKDSTLPDHERPLNGRGRRAAELLREFLKQKALQPEFVLSSPSLRTRQTVEILFARATTAPDIRYDENLYLASVAQLLEIISSFEEARDQVLVVGHNPGIEELYFKLTGIDERFPTATLANISFEVDTWSEASKARGKVQWLVKPRQLEVT
jgi:phosphohistidine phosphatase